MARLALVLTAVLIALPLTSPVAIALEPVPPPAATQLDAEALAQLEEVHAGLDTALDAPPAEAAELYGQMGQLYLAYNFPDAAAPAFRNAHKLASDDFRWPYYLGLLAQAEAELGAAAEHFRAALGLKPAEAVFTPAAAWIRLGDVELGRGNGEAAAEAYERAIALRAEAAAAYFGLGRIALQAGEAEVAIEHFERALALQPVASQVRVPLAQAHRRTGNTGEARRQLAERGDVRLRFVDPLVELLRLLVVGAEGHLRDSQVALAEQRWGEAVEHARRAVAVRLESFDAQKALVVALYSQALAGEIQPDDVLDEAKRLTELEPEGRAGEVGAEKAWAHYTLGTVYVRQNNDLRALIAFREAEALAPHMEQLLRELGQLYGRVGYLDDAASMWTRVLELVPDDREALLKRATSRMDARHYEEALPDLERLLELEPGDPGHVLRHAGALHWLGRHEGAISAYQKALDDGLRGGKGELFARLQLSKLYEDSEMWAPALEQFQAILALDPQHQVAGIQAGVLSMRLGRWAEARQALEKALARDSGNGVVIFHLARLLAASPDPLIRDPLRALDLATVLRDAAETPENTSNLAMAHAAAGDFENAAFSQRRAVELAQEAGRTELAARLGQVLRSYEAGQLWLPTFPDELFD